ncbi:hypothetical protein BDN70DRAFT_885650 [Pholiota conissans]|uniref:Uncharacterized protein n=1 Tax=Pholiota conissans TaxID=109636 RepID=A0A9P5YQN5_9AGAR|nr:hypothetical protein BDN70DRAFT_885650 [Pholiota conissans]
MPPPPMPAALDPTTISSLPIQPSLPISTFTPSPPSPQLLTPSLPEPSVSLQPTIVHPNVNVKYSNVHAHLPLHLAGVVDSPAMGISPLTGFANLSLLSPALPLDKNEKPRASEEAMTTEIVRDKEIGKEQVVKVHVSTSLPPPSQKIAEIAEIGVDEDAAKRESERIVVDEDVEMQDFDLERDERREAREETETTAELSSTWSPLRRTPKVGMDAVEAHTLAPSPSPESSPAVQPVSLSIGKEATPDIVAIVDDESRKAKFAASPLDSMASTPASRRSPVNSVPPDDADEVELQEKSVVSVRITSIPARHVSASLEELVAAPLDNNIASATTPNITISALKAAKTLPPDHFFDTDDEEEWKRQMEIDVDVQRLPSETKVEVAELVNDRERVEEKEEEEVEEEVDGQKEEEVEEEDDGEETPRRPSVTRRMRTPRIVSSDSSGEEEGHEVHEVSFSVPQRKRKASIDSSRSVSTAPEAEGRAKSIDGDVEMEIHETPPSTVSTIATVEAPPTSAESAAPNESPTEERRPSPEPAPQLSTNATTTSPVETTMSSTTVEPQVSSSPLPSSKSLATDGTSIKKISLKEWKLRKDQRKEQEVTTQSAQASPMSVLSALAAEDGEGSRERERENERGSMSKPIHMGGGVDVGAKEGGGTEASENASARASGVNASASTAAKTNGDRPSISNKSDVAPTPTPAPLDRSKTAWWLSQTNKPPAVEAKAKQDGSTNTIDGKPWLKVTTKLPNELKSVELSSPKVISSASPAIVSASTPSTSLPPMTAKSVVAPEESVVNGLRRPSASIPPHPQPPAPLVSSPKLPILPAKTPHFLPPRPQQSYTPPSSHSFDTREAKKELLDSPLPPLSAPLSTALPYTSAAPLPRRHSMLLDRSMSPISPDLNAHSRRSSHEDGEIEGTPQLRGYNRSNPHNVLNPRPLPPNLIKGRPNYASPSIAHSPPTGPRSSFNPPSTSPVPSFIGSSYRPPPQSASSMLTSTSSGTTSTPVSRPAPPSAPRALRQHMMNNKPGSNVMAAAAASYYHGGSNIPRGPSADRDNQRERERERDRDYSSRYLPRPRRFG